MSPVRGLDCRSTPRKRQNLFVYRRLNTHKFEGHETPNQEEYQKSVQLKFRYCHSKSFDYTHATGGGRQK